MTNIYTLKKLLWFLSPLLLISFSSSQNLLAQNCPNITSWNLVTVSDNGLGACTYRVDYTMTVFGNNKSVNTNVTCNGNPAINECVPVDVSQNGITISSSIFACPCASVKTLTFTSYTNGACGGVFCITSGNVLPIVLEKFVVSKQLNGINLIEWEVSEELNVANYQIELSTDSKNFATAGLVLARNSQFYSFSHDASGFSGTLYYRLKTIDLDGQVSYSNIVALQKEENQSFVILGHTTSNSLFLSDLNGTGNVQIFDNTGKLVAKAIAMQPTLEMDISALSPGIYFVQHSGNNFKSVRKFIK